MPFKSFLVEPVKWLTWVSGLLTAATAVEAALAETPLHLPPAVAAWTGTATVVVTAILGAAARGRVTPLARPRTADGRALVAPSRFE